MSASSKIVLQSSKLTLLSSSVVPGQAFSPPDPFHFPKQSKKGNRKITRHCFGFTFLGQ